MSGSAAWVPGGDKLGSSECLDENPVDPRASASSGAAGGAAASSASSLSAASLSAEGDVMQAFMNENMALRSALRMDEEEEGQATSAVDPAPSRELPAQILNSTLYSNSMRYAVGTSQYGLDTSQYTVVFTGVVRRGGGNM